MDIFRAIGDREGEARSWFNLGLALENTNREADVMGAYRNARQLYQAIRLDADVQDCDNQIERLSQPVSSPRRGGWLSRLRQWLQRVWRWIMGR